MVHDPDSSFSFGRSVGVGHLLLRPSTDENVGNDLLTGPEIGRYQPLFDDDNFVQREGILSMKMRSQGVGQDMIQVIDSYLTRSGGGLLQQVPRPQNQTYILSAKNTESERQSGRLRSQKNVDLMQYRDLNCLGVSSYTDRFSDPLDRNYGTYFEAQDRDTRNPNAGNSERFSARATNHVH